MNKMCQQRCLKSMLVCWDDRDDDDDDDDGDDVGMVVVVVVIIIPRQLWHATTHS